MVVRTFDYSNQRPDSNPGKFQNYDYRYYISHSLLPQGVDACSDDEISDTFELTKPQKRST